MSWLVMGSAGLRASMGISSSSEAPADRQASRAPIRARFTEGIVRRGAGPGRTRPGGAEAESQHGWSGLVFALSFGLAACGGSAATLTPSPAHSPSAVQHASLTVNGQQRTYRLFRPPSLDPTSTAPLVLALHGLPSTGDELASITHLNDQAMTSRFIVAYPDGLGGGWNAAGTGLDDVIFISRLLDRLTGDLRIDRKRVFVAGVSNGGMMAYRLACQLSDRIAAVASVSGTMEFGDCRPTRPVSVLEIHGTDDSSVEYGGGRYPSVDSVIQQWVTLDGCPGQPAPTVSGITRTSLWKACREGTVVRLDTVQGGHHQWFGSDFDPVAGEPDANAVIWDFFSNLE